MSQENQVRVGVAVVVVNENHEILLGKRIAKSGKPGNGNWQLPGGHQDFGEFIADTVVREVREETNLTINAPIYICHTEEIYEDIGKQYVTFFYLAKADDASKLLNTEPTKCEGWQWFKITNLPEPLFAIVPSTLNAILTAIRQLIMTENGTST